jgi:hypothetical protein
MRWYVWDSKTGYSNRKGNFILDSEIDDMDEHIFQKKSISKHRNTGLEVLSITHCSAKGSGHGMTQIRSSLYFNSAKGLEKRVICIEMNAHSVLPELQPRSLNS